MNLNENNMNPASTGGFRAQYNTHGVSKYYSQFASTYRNPHFPGVQKCIHLCLDRILPHIPCSGLQPHHTSAVSLPLSILDLAAGSGEATISTISYFQNNRHRSPSTPLSGAAVQFNSFPTYNADSSSSSQPLNFIQEGLKIRIFACDPFTSDLYTQKTGLYCSKRGFKELIIEGIEGLVSEFYDHCSNLKQQQQPRVAVAPIKRCQLRKTVDIIICSFALHLVPEGGELWGLLYELSRGAQWMVVVAPHKKPEIDETGRMGWVMEEGEVLVKEERVRGRVFRSVNYEQGEEEDEEKKEQSECEVGKDTTNAS